MGYNFRKRLIRVQVIEGDLIWLNIFWSGGHGGQQGRTTSTLKFQTQKDIFVTYRWKDLLKTNNLIKKIALRCFLRNL